VIAWVMLVGAAGALVPALVSRPASPPDAGSLLMLLLSGLTYVGGLSLAYAALSVGRVGIVAPILATEGAIAALIAVALGESLTVPVAATLVAIALGVVLAAVERDPDGTGARVREAHEDPGRAVLLAVLGALTFGVGLVASARAGGAFPVAWVVLASRSIGVLVILVPLLAQRRLQLTRAVVPLVVAAGLLEAVGTVLYVVGSQAGVAVTAVMGSQFAAIAAVGAFFLFGERLQRIQVAGVAVIFLGVGILAVLRA
jgi:drug/metabolite transporter (DMT)-like permease